MSAPEILLAAPPPAALDDPARFGAAPAATSLAALLPVLAQDMRIRLLVASPESMAWPVPPGIDVVGPDAFAASAALRALPRVFELGDHPAHRFVLDLARGGGGLLVLNDLSLHGLVEAETLGAGDGAAYAAACTAEAGPAGTAIARARLRGLDVVLRRSVLPMTAALLSRARGAVVHGAAAAARLRVRPGLDVQVGCRAVDPSGSAPSQVSRIAARSALGLPGNAAVLLVAAGSADPMGAISVLRALRQRHPNACLVSDGPCPALARQAEMRGCDDVVRAGAETIRHGLPAADVVLDLDPFSTGAASALIDASLAAGLPVVGYRHGPAAMLSRPLALCVPYAENAAAQLAAAASELLGMATRGGFIASEARSYLRQNRSPERAALAYLRGVHAMRLH
ncbi:glycosyltransferase family protein [Plastoroseomonas arctica]|uniref:Glycosyltransferase n=1 Tax=Plastoroseomonas arctica TaxID=1509237 RepID=A0AAF1JZ06_9PROT|nr:hypothetical protein [Plastoroseomonas arctica]MBR0657467.1 hypothetical protein [Plastoroseomonas arctica]